MAETISEREGILFDEPECKGCSASVHVSQATLLAMVEKTRAGGQGAGALLDSAAYDHRIRACNGCESLQFGTTCRWCGCLVAVKAQKPSAKCPHPSGSRW